eukprot:gene14713-biopygen5368
MCAPKKPLKASPHHHRRHRDNPPDLYEAVAPQPPFLCSHRGSSDRVRRRAVHRPRREDREVQRQPGALGVHFSSL